MPDRRLLVLENVITGPDMSGPDWLTLERVDEAGVHGFRLVQRHSATGDTAGDFGVFVADQNATAIANALLQEQRP